MKDNRLTGEDELDLITAIRSGKQEAIGILYDAYAPVLMGVINKIIPSIEVAEEVLRETFLAIWTRIDIYDSSKNRFLTWALAIARGIALEANKSERFARLISASQEATMSKPENNASTGNEEKEDLYLDVQEKTILDLIYHKGFTCSQVCNKLNITEEKLKTVLKTAFKHLKAEKTA